MGITNENVDSETLTSVEEVKRVIDSGVLRFVAGRRCREAAAGLLRDAGMTYREIGTELGVTRQGASYLCAQHLARHRSDL